MRHQCLALVALLTAVGSGTVSAQKVLRAAPSGRGTSQVLLSYPRAVGAPVAAGEDTATRAITVDYGQPHLRGRKMFTDTLVPYDKPWRLGANGPTTLKTDVDLQLGGALIPRGSYVLYTIPSQAGWKLVVAKHVGQDAMDYTPGNELARIDLRRRELSSPIESLTMWLIPARAEAGAQRGELRIAWANTELATDWVVR